MNRLELKRPLDPQEWLSLNNQNKLSLVRVEDLFDIYQQYEDYAEYVINWIPFGQVADSLCQYEDCTGNVSVYNNVLGINQSFYVKASVNHKDKTVAIEELYKDGNKLDRKSEIWEALCIQLGFPVKPF